jgi:hypothetical protein
VSEDVVYDTLESSKTHGGDFAFLYQRPFGTSFSYAEVKAVLERDHLTYLSEKGDAFTLAIPAYRVDLQGEADISEEVIRLLGFDHIQSKLPARRFSRSKAASTLGRRPSSPYAAISAIRLDRVRHLFARRCQTRR